MLPDPFGPIPAEPKLRLSTEEIRELRDKAGDAKGAYLSTLPRLYLDVMADTLALVNWYEAWAARYEQFMQWLRWTIVFGIGITVLGALIRARLEGAGNVLVMAPAAGLVLLAAMHWSVLRWRRECRQRADSMRRVREMFRNDYEVAHVLLQRYPDGIPDEAVRLTAVDVDGQRGGASAAT